MPHTFEEVQKIAYELPEEQRILLANSLLDGVDPNADNPAEIEAAWEVEIKRRLDEIDSGAVKMIPLEEVLARMDARLLAKQRG